MLDAQRLKIECLAFQNNWWKIIFKIKAFTFCYLGLYGNFMIHLTSVYDFNQKII